MKSGFDNYDGIWGNSYYEDRFAEVSDNSANDFTHQVFAARPALIFRDEQGQVSSIEKLTDETNRKGGEIDPAGWTHEHCDVCEFCIDPGHSYWEAGHVCLCDACYEHYFGRGVSTG